MPNLSTQNWWAGWGSNPRPSAPKAEALSAKLPAHLRNRVRITPDGTRTRDLSITDRPLSGTDVVAVTRQSVARPGGSI